ncbi:MAG: DUF5011 domain-containing protein [Coriobacteriales bacterium]|nr:DUF5011 domain-containing protein [Coriobacteriales bacterium]
MNENNTPRRRKSNNQGQQPARNYSNKYNDESFRRRAPRGDGGRDYYTQHGNEGFERRTPRGDEGRIHRAQRSNSYEYEQYQQHNIENYGQSGQYKDKNFDQRTRLNSGNQNYNNGTSAHAQHSRYNSHHKPKKKSKAPIVIICVILVIALAAILAFVIVKCTSGEEELPQSVKEAELAHTDNIIMTVLGDPSTKVLKGEKYLEAGCRAFDLEDGIITNSVETSGEVDTSTAGTYEIKYTATNSKQQTNTATRKVEVVDNMEVDNDGISVLMYHYVYDAVADTSKKDTNNLPATKFEEQLQWLTSEGYYYPSYPELSEYCKGTHSLPAKSVVLTFDDCEDLFVQYAIPLVEKYKVPITSFVICGNPRIIENMNTHPSAYVNYQSHSVMFHQGGNKGNAINDYDLAGTKADLAKAADVLQANQAFAYPFGDVGPFGAQAVKENGILCAFTTKYGQAHKGDDTAILKRIRIFGDGTLAGFKAQVTTGG